MVCLVNIASPSSTLSMPCPGSNMAGWNTYCTIGGINEWSFHSITWSWAYTYVHTNSINNNWLQDVLAKKTYMAQTSCSQQSLIEFAMHILKVNSLAISNVAMSLYDMIPLYLWEIHHALIRIKSASSSTNVFAHTAPGSPVESTEGVPLGWAYSSLYPASPPERL